MLSGFLPSVTELVTDEWLLRKIKIYIYIYTYTGPNKLKIEIPHLHRCRSPCPYTSLQPIILLVLYLPLLVTIYLFIHSFIHSLPRINTVIQYAMVHISGGDGGWGSVHSRSMYVCVYSTTSSTARTNHKIGSRWNKQINRFDIWFALSYVHQKLGVYFCYIQH